MKKYLRYRINFDILHKKNQRLNCRISKKMCRPLQLQYKTRIPQQGDRVASLFYVDNQTNKYKMLFYHGTIKTMYQKNMLVRFDDNTEYDYEINDGKWINIPKLGQYIKVLWDIELKSKGKVRKVIKKFIECQVTRLYKNAYEVFYPDDRQTMKHELRSRTWCNEDDEVMFNTDEIEGELLEERCGAYEFYVRKQEENVKKYEKVVEHIHMLRKAMLKSKKGMVLNNKYHPKKKMIWNYFRKMVQKEIDKNYSVQIRIN